MYWKQNMLWIDPTLTVIATNAVVFHRTFDVPRFPNDPGGNTNRYLCFFLIIIFRLVAFVRINRVKPVLRTHVSCPMRPSAHHSKHSACARHVYKFIWVHAELVNFTCTLPRPHAFIRYKFLNFVYEPQTSQQCYQYNTFNGLAPGWFVGNENKLKPSAKYMPSVFGKTIFFNSLFIHFQTL